MKTFKDQTTDRVFTLERLPITTQGDLRAWNAADELLLNYVFEESLHDNIHPVLLINDAFGALAIGFNNFLVHSWSDSAITNYCTQLNYQNNQLDEEKYTFIPSTSVLEMQYDLVLIKIPKTLALLEDQLCRLKPHIHATTCVIASAMTKHIHNSTIKLFEKIIGPTKTSRATKKARLIFATNDSKLTHLSPFPTIVKDKALKLDLSNHANVFSNKQLDIGTRFFLEHLSQCPASKNIIDLGCGNGALGIIAKRLQPLSQVSFIDESYMAISSAKENYNKNVLLDTETKNARFYISNCLDQLDFSLEIDRPDLILCNPPFHQVYSIGDHIAWKMFQQSHDSLVKAGQLWVIGNRHLGHHVKMKKLFGNCKTVSSNKKFVILVSVKR